MTIQPTSHEQRKLFFRRLLFVTAASLVFAVNLKSFVQAGDLFPGGFTGTAVVPDGQGIDRVVSGAVPGT